MTQARTVRMMAKAPHAVRTEYWLPLIEIVEAWACCGEDEEGVTRALVNAFWRGRFEDFARVPPSRFPMMSRREMLIAWRDLGSHDRVTFSATPEGQLEEDEDGSLLVDLATHILLPQDPGAWTNKQLDSAYQALANCSWVDVNSDARAGLMCQFVGAYELLSLCAELKTDAPPFWAHWQPKGKANLRELAKIVSWFEMKCAIHTPRPTKPALREFALAEFPWLKAHRFDEVWEQFAPEAWKTGGRPTGSKAR
jgi:hypothetical protein